MLDLSGLITKINNLIEVAKDWISKIWDVYFDTTAKNVTVKKLKSDGTIANTSIPNIAKVKQEFWALVPAWGSVFLHDTASTGSISSSSGYDSVTTYGIDLSSANAADPSTSIVTSETVTTISTPISLSGWYPLLGGSTEILEILGADELVNLDFARLEGNFVFDQGSNDSKRYVSIEIGHDKDEAKIVSSYAAGYNELHPEWSIMGIMVAEKGRYSRVWIKPPSDNPRLGSVAL